jgi:nitrilase
MKIAIIQHAPVLFDLKNTMRKVAELMQEASEANPDLMMFPEAFIPGYPRGLTFGTKVGDRSAAGRDLFSQYVKNAVAFDGQEIKQLGQLAKNHKTYLVIGLVELGHTGTLYCTTAYFSPQGDLIGKHRKMKPTGAERIIWGEGDGSDLQIYATPFGNLGGLICWENYMPLARTWLYQQGVQIYLAPTADNRSGWQHTLKHIALEGRCFVVGCNQFVEKSDYPEWLFTNEDLSALPDIVSAGGSVVIDPFGNEVVAPLWDRSGIMHAELDLSLLVKAKLDFDAVGHYARNDIFELTKKRR